MDLCSRLAGHGIIGAGDVVVAGRGAAPATERRAVTETNPSSSAVKRKPLLHPCRKTLQHS